MPKPKLIAKPYPALLNAIESGVAYGYMRAFKHCDNPSEHAIKQAIIDAVINEICERFQV